MSQPRRRRRSRRAPGAPAPPEPVAGADDATFPHGGRGSKVPPDGALRPDPRTVPD